MKISELDRRITLQLLQETIHASGEVIRDYVDVATVWAKVEPKIGAESADGDRIQVSTGFTVTIRYRAGISPAMRLQYKGEAYKITNIVELGRKQGLELQIERHT